MCWHFLKIMSLIMSISTILYSQFQNPESSEKPKIYKKHTFETKSDLNSFGGKT